MSFAAGTISLVSVTSTTANLSCTAATGGTGPYTYQWYRSTTSGFSPGAGNIISGATSLTLADTGLIPGTLYYYVVVATDTGNSNVTANSAQLGVTTSAPVQSQNQFAQSPYLGMIDMRFPYNTVSVQIDVSQATALYAGSAVKMVDSADGTPKVVGCAAATDEVLGFINFDIKTVQFLAGSLAEISMAGNVMYLYATAAIARGAQVVLDLSTNGGVKTIPGGSSGDNVVGWAYDKATAAGQLIRVFLKTPSYVFDT
jgi:hypothetical protein